MEKFPSDSQDKEIRELPYDFLGEESALLGKFNKNKHKNIKNFLRACTIYGMALLGTLSAKEALAGGDTGFRNFAEQKSGLFRETGIESSLEKKLAENFIQEVGNIDENLSVNEIEKAIQLAFSRMELGLNAQQNAQRLVQGRSDIKTKVIGDGARDVLERQNAQNGVIEKSSLSPKIKEILNSMTNSVITID